VRDLGLADLHDYCRYIFEEGGLASEFVQLIDAVTTNKTDFFREPMHFQFLTEVLLPEAVRDHGHSGVRIWSAACSIGAEPYTIAMVLDDYARRVRHFRYEVVATDISTDVLRTAIEGVYDMEMTEPIPPELRDRYLMRARDPDRRQARIVPELRSAVRFGRLNLMDQKYPVPTDMDAIFCRNILIYFDRATQLKVLERLSRHLRPGGYLILGHSETLTGMALPLRSVGPTIFRND
jgi:chemotaxis protein methyltransferase CheR